ncbi:MAG: DUF3486 family protein [Ahrensia sp.]|nr:DUF3486 family protein [Ahrensia sp.]
MARTTRGRLNAIEQLPAQADGIVAWAAQELASRDRTQTEIYQEFHSQLEALHKEYRGELDFKIPSFSAFNRHSIKLATLRRRIDDTRDIAKSIASSFDAEASDDLTLIAAEAIKTLCFEILTNAGEGRVDPKGAMQLAAALRSATQAQNVSTSRRLKAEKEFERNVDEVLEQAARTTGLSSESAEQIKRDVLGLT